LEVQELRSLASNGTLTTETRYSHLCIDMLSVDAAVRLLIWAA